MKAGIFQGTKQIGVTDRPDPKIVESTDAVVRVVLSCVCGSDLWFYRGVNPREVGAPIGHEFMGIVEDVGSDVQKIKKGDLVIAPFLISDGTCAYCQAGMTANCVHGGGWGRGGTDGGQGEAVRVPQADGTLFVVPGSGHGSETMKSLLTLSDVMCTGYHAAVSAGVKKGDTVAVVGDGAVGLCGVIAARMLGAERIIAMSRHQPRQKLATVFGATDIVEERGGEAIDKVMQITEGVGVDAALECVGTQEAVETAFGISRPGATIGAVGLPHDVTLPFRDMFFKNVGILGGPSPARAYMPKLIDDVLNGNITPGLVFDFETSLDNLNEAYAAMDERRAIKSLLRVSEA